MPTNEPKSIFCTPEQNREEKNVVGGDFPRVDLWGKVRGQAKFCADLYHPHTLHALLVRSPYPHAEIVSVDTSEAEALPDVKAVLTGKDLPIPYGILPVTQDETALAQEKVRYAGEPVVAVCATTLEEAERASQLIRIEYRSLPVVRNIYEAAEEKALVQERRQNAQRVISLEFGNLQEGERQATLIEEGLYFYSGNTHASAEPHAVLAVPEVDHLALYVSHQAPYYLNQILPKVLDIPPHRLRLIVPYVGGGFGGKLDPFPEIVCAAKFALLLHRPVRIVLSREEVFYNHRGRHPALIRLRTALKGKKLVSLHLEGYLDGGAYGSFGAAASYYIGALTATTYDIRHYRAQVVRFLTNKPPCGPKRGHGTPQPRFALEVHMDKLAEKVGLDPISFRLENLLEGHAKTVNHLTITTSGLRECIQWVAKESAFSTKWKKLPRGKGIGFAVGCYLSGAALPIYWNDLPHSEVTVKLDRRGTVSAYSGHTEIGQGSDHVLATIVAEVLGLEPAEVHLVLRDSYAVPPDMGSYSSRVTMMMGRAALEAAEKLRSVLLQTAAQEWEVPEDSVQLERGQALGPQGQKMSFEELAWKSEARLGQPLIFSGAYRPSVEVGPYKGAGVGPSPTYSFSACAIEVEVCLKSGRVRPQKLWLAHDIGRALHPKSVLGQIEGSVHMGLSEALWEESSYNKFGLQRAVSLLDYRMVPPTDMPEMFLHLVETPEQEGPFGAKEVGQGPLLPVVPALANAVYDAIGVRFDEIPITPVKVWRALEHHMERVGPRKLPSFSFPEPKRVETPR